MQSMTINSTEESAAYLVDMCKTKGFDVKEEQIADWASEVFTTTFRREYPGQGKGSKTIYEAGTAQQLLLFCHVHFREKKRRVADVGWRMWWHYGCDVKKKIWKQQLAKAVSLFDSTIGTIREYDADSGEYVIKPEIEDEFSKFAIFRTSHKILRRIRRHVLSTVFPDLMRTAMRMAIGGFSGWEGHLSEGEEKQGQLSEEQLFEKGLGFDRAKKDHGQNSKPWLKGDLARVFKKMSPHFQKPFADILDTVSDADLYEARDELRIIFAATEECKNSFEKEHGKRAFGFNVSGQFIQDASPLTQAIMLVLWLRIRREPEFAEGINQKLPEFRKMVSASLPPSDQSRLK